MGMKCVSVRSWNPSDSLPMVPATVMLLDPRNGVCKACVGATYLTASRTAAGSAIATKLCLQNLYNNNDNKKKKQSIDNSEKIKIHLVVFGAGLQAELHCVMMDTILSNTFYTPNNDSFEQNNQEFILDKITIVNRTLENAQKLQTKLFKKRNEYVFKHHTNSCNNNSPPPEIQICKLSSCEDIVRSADVIVTATNSSKPLFDGSWVRKNCHVNCVGSYTSDTRETDQILVNRSRIIMDTKEAINVGDLNHLVYKENNSNILGLLGDFVSGAKTLDDDDDSNNELDITYYKSVGTAIQDIVTAQAVLDVAQTLDLGVDINMNDDGDS
jgi:ornithine cyclodeaminase